VVLTGAAAVDDEVQRVRDVLREALRAGRAPTAC
jgi:hypothetical protein